MRSHPLPPPKQESATIDLKEKGYSGPAQVRIIQAQNFYIKISLQEEKDYFMQLNIKDRLKVLTMNILYGLPLEGSISIIIQEP